MGYDNAAQCGTLEEHSLKAIVRTRYGSPDVLQFAEIATPTPGENEVLIKLCAASVNSLVWRLPSDVGT
jgi:hypothetical protein